MVVRKYEGHVASLMQTFALAAIPLFVSHSLVYHHLPHEHGNSARLGCIPKLQTHMGCLPKLEITTLKTSYYKSVEHPFMEWKPDLQPTITIVRPL